MLAVWVVIGLVAGLLAGSIWKAPRPFGEWGDYLIAVGVAVLTGLADWYLLPAWFDVSGQFRFWAAVLEPILVVLLVLWLLRRLRR